MLSELKTIESTLNGKIDAANKKLEGSESENKKLLSQVTKKNANLNQVTQ